MNFSDTSVAVLTGDIVNSSDLEREQRQTLFAALKSAAEVISAWNGVEPTGFERFAGDSWQLLLTTPGIALRACLMLRAYIRAENRTFETRISVGIGSVEPLSSEGLGASDGVAFRLSGRGLADLPKNRFFGLHGSAEVNAAFILADSISQDWTQKQAAALVHGLQPNRISHDAMAQILGISKQAVAKRLASAKAPALLAAAELFEDNLLR